MTENENQKTLDEESNKLEETKKEETKEEIKEDKIEEKNEVNKVEEKEQEPKKIEKETKNSEIKENEKEEKDNKNEETKKDENENDDDEEQKKLIKSINEIKSESIKARAIFLYDINEDMKSQYLDTYKSEKLSIELKELDNFLNYYNKIREIINSSTEDKEKYSIIEKEEEKEEFAPIKNFWSISLINAKFFELSEKDKKVLENLIDIKFIPLEYPSFKIEFIFKENEYLEENTIYKIYHFQKNEKDDIEKTESSQIKWKSDEKNPTIKIIIKRKKKSKEIITKEVDSFFNIFKTEDKEEKLDKELVEANFFRNDFLENMLEYYLNIMEIKYNEENDDNENEDEK